MVAISRGKKTQTKPKANKKKIPNLPPGSGGQTGCVNFHGKIRETVH